MSFNSDFDAYAAIARERQKEILRVSASSHGQRPRPAFPSLALLLALVCGPLAVLFFFQVW